MSVSFLARHAIYDRQLNVAGYELLFRNGVKNQAEFDDEDAATCHVITTALVDIGLKTLVGKVPAYINVTRSFIEGALPLPESKDQVVLEVAGDTVPSIDMTVEIKRLVDNGYRIALDNFCYQPEFDELLKLIHIVKLDLRRLDREELALNVEKLRSFDLTLIAEKVETYEELELCQSLDIDLYQGFFFCKPKVVSAHSPDANRLIVLKLLTQMQDVSKDFDDLEELISCDPVLSYRLLRYANSAYCGLRQEVTSIHHALVLVGVDRVRQWALLLMMSQMADGKPAELFTVAMVRAQMCATLGDAQPDHSSGEYFMVGLLSVLDALMDQPMDVVLSELPLSTASKHALIKQVGPLGQTLNNVLRYERGEDPEDDEERFAGAYLSAICWSNEVLHGLAA